MGVREEDEGEQPDQAPEGGVPSVEPGRRGKPLTGVDGPRKGFCKKMNLLFIKK